MGKITRLLSISLLVLLAACRRDTPFSETSVNDPVHFYPARFCVVNDEALPIRSNGIFRNSTLLYPLRDQPAHVSFDSLTQRLCLLYGTRVELVDVNNWEMVYSAGLPFRSEKIKSKAGKAVLISSDAPGTCRILDLAHPESFRETAYDFMLTDMTIDSAHVTLLGKEQLLLCDRELKILSSVEVKGGKAVAKSGPDLYVLDTDGLWYYSIQNNSFHEKQAVH